MIIKCKECDGTGIDPHSIKSNNTPCRTCAGNGGFDEKVSGSPQQIAARIRNKVTDLNDELLLANLAEVDVEFEVITLNNADVPQLRVWCSQEV